MTYDLDQLTKLEQAATPGKWMASKHTHKRKRADAWYIGFQVGGYAQIGTTWNDMQAEADAALIRARLRGPQSRSSRACSRAGRGNCRGAAFSTEAPSSKAASRADPVQLANASPPAAWQPASFQPRLNGWSAAFWRQPSSISRKRAKAFALSHFLA